MSPAARVVLAVFFGSCLGTVCALLAGASWWRWVSAPALIVSGWAAVGHLVTLDDDAPGGWSNPDQSRSFWRTSLSQLAIKASVFGAVVWFVATDWSR